MLARACGAVHAVRAESDATPWDRSDRDLDEDEAYRYALQLAAPGKVIVLFYDDYSLVEAALKEAGARPAQFAAEPVREMQTALQGAAS